MKPSASATPLVETQIEKPTLPNGLAWATIIDSEESYNIQMIRANVENFAQATAQEIIDCGSRPVRIVIPISGGFVAANAVLKALSAKGFNVKDLDIVFATHKGNSETYYLSKGVSGGGETTTFLIDDIYDSGDSFNAVLEHFKESPFQARYLSTKLGKTLGEGAFSGMYFEMDVINDDWAATSNGMNSGINGKNKEGAIVNHYLYDKRDEIEVLERLVGVPIIVQDMSQVLNWSAAEVDAYIAALKSNAIKFYTDPSEETGMKEIYENIIIVKRAALESGSLDSLFTYLNQQVLPRILGMNGFSSEQ